MNNEINFFKLPVNLKILVILGYILAFILIVILCTVIYLWSCSKKEKEKENDVKEKHKKLLETFGNTEKELGVKSGAEFELKSENNLESGNELESEFNQENGSEIQDQIISKEVFPKEVFSKEVFSEDVEEKLIDSKQKQVQINIYFKENFDANDLKNLLNVISKY